ncbi:MAG: N-acetylmuramoyl-L-alanine amidase [Thermoguttaceae bacterium]|nr:N-acetylmuramoyl-L-alanine amidase [Thermoguttaceae bacterium]
MKNTLYPISMQQRGTLTLSVLTLLFLLLTGTATFAEDENPLPMFKPESVSVFLSPSNQIHNVGFGDYGTEKERMNDVCDVIVPILKEHGVTVYRNDPEKNLKDYVAEANEKNVDLYFAIHSNAANQKARGTECFCYRFGGEGERFAKRVNAALVAIYDGPNRGVKESHSHFGPGKPLYETANPKAPAALVEVAFHDEKRDATWILENRELIGKVLANAILEHLAAEHPDAVQK